MKRRVEHLNDGDVVRYDEEATDTGVDVQAAWTQAEQDAKAGKRICLTDLIGMRETQHLKRLRKDSANNPARDAEKGTP